MFFVFVFVVDVARYASKHQLRSLQSDGAAACTLLTSKALPKTLQARSNKVS